MENARDATNIGRVVSSMNRIQKIDPHALERFADKCEGIAIGIEMASKVNHERG